MKIRLELITNRSRLPASLLDLGFLEVIYSCRLGNPPDGTNRPVPFNAPDLFEYVINLASINPS